MPVVLSQHFAPQDRVYEDAEFALYHYPSVYFNRVVAFDRFLYYRPLGKSRQRPDSKHYFGHGRLGQWFEDPHRPDHRFVAIMQGEYFPSPVPLLDAAQHYYETESSRQPQAQASVREISETAYYRILSAGGVSSRSLFELPSTENAEYSPLRVPAPIDAFRRISTIPPGAGYTPSVNYQLNVYECASLQERARKDHQAVLATIQRAIIARGGATWYNNNVDLYGRLGEQRYLIEAKSLNDTRAALDRVRYGIGQLADYAYRYGEELERPQKVLAFAVPPPRELSWLGDVLDRERTAFLSVAHEDIEPLNDVARQLTFL